MFSKEKEKRKLNARQEKKREKIYGISNYNEYKIAKLVVKDCVMKIHNLYKNHNYEGFTCESDVFKALCIDSCVFVNDKGKVLYGDTTINDPRMFLWKSREYATYLYIHVGTMKGNKHLKDIIIDKSMIIKEEYRHE